MCVYVLILSKTSILHVVVYRPHGSPHGKACGTTTYEEFFSCEDNCFTEDNQFLFVSCKEVTETCTTVQLMSKLTLACSEHTYVCSSIFVE